MLKEPVTECDPPNRVGRVPRIQESEVRVGPVREKTCGQPSRRTRLVHFGRLLQGRVDLGRVWNIQVFRVTKHFVGGFPGFPDHRACVKRLPKDRFRIVPELCRRLVSRAKRGRGSDADQMPFGDHVGRVL